MNLLVRRNLIGSDAIILVAVGIHVFEATYILAARGADWTIPFQAFLAAFGSPAIAAGALYLSCVLAIVGLWVGPVEHYVRAALLLGQFTLLMLTSLWASHYAINGYGAGPSECETCISHHVDGWPIFINQIHRILLPLPYFIAALVRVGAGRCRPI